MLASPFGCRADGKTHCLYKKGNNLAFRLLCECALNNEADSNAGYCPIPDVAMLDYNIRMMKIVWQGDNCHTYDRDNLESQMECGIGKVSKSFATAVQTNFNMTYWPYIQSPGNYECLQNFVPNSYKRVVA